MAGHRNAHRLSGADWAARAAHAWERHAARLTAQLEPVNPILLAAADVQPGERVLEVGCGDGATTVHLLAAAGAAGHVTAVDVAENLVRRARRRLDGAPVDLRVGDAQTEPFPAATTDVVVSRFGVMFFDDPVAAFGNLARATRPGGRLAVAVWPPDGPPAVQRGQAVAVRVAAELGLHLTPPPPDSGPFGFGRPEYALSLLQAAGWRDPRFTTHTIGFYVGGPGTTPAQAAAMAMEIGPVQWLTEDAPQHVRDAVEPAIAADLAATWDGVGLRLDGRVAILTATRPRAAA